MIVSEHLVASQVGLSILKDGGTAADAAWGMALATAVVIPDMCGLGGESFALYQSPKGPLVSYQGGGKLPWDFDPALLEITRFLLPLHGGPSISVLGSVDLYLTLHQTHGYHPLYQIAQPAQGFLVDGGMAERRIESETLVGHAVRDRFYPHEKALQQGDWLSLEKNGHRIAVIGPDAGGGSAHVIWRQPAEYGGASDPCGSGQTLGY